MPTAILFGFGVQELVLILVIVLVVFGASKIPQLMRGLGTGIKEFKEAVKDNDVEGKELPADTHDDKSTKD